MKKIASDAKELGPWVPTLWEVCVHSIQVLLHTWVKPQQWGPLACRLCQEWGAWLRWHQSPLHPARGRKCRGLEQPVLLALSFKGHPHCLLPTECGALQTKLEPPRNPIPTSILCCKGPMTPSHMCFKDTLWIYIHIYVLIDYTAILNVFTLRGSFCISSVRLLSCVWLFLTLCDPMDCSTPGLPVHHQLPEFAQIHLHWVSDAIQQSHPLSSPSPPAFNLSRHQGLFKWVGSSGGQSIEVSASASVLPMNIQDWSPLGWTGWISLQSKGLSRVFSNTTVQKHQCFGAQFSL